jgi:hypothetical protein
MTDDDMGRMCKTRNAYMTFNCTRFKEDKEVGRRTAFKWILDEQAANI